MACECKPTAAACNDKGLTWSDWASSIFYRLCDTLAWLGGIFDNTSIAPGGVLPLSPVQYGFNAIMGVPHIIIVPAGALCIQAVIDNDYAATYRINAQIQGGADYPLPAGTDLNLPVISPMYRANSEGRNCLTGQGVYPQYTLTFPAGARGFVSAIYPTSGNAFIITPTP